MNPYSGPAVVSEIGALSVSQGLDAVEAWSWHNSGIIGPPQLIPHLENRCFAASRMSLFGFGSD